jgi:hypothetical protein
MEMISPKVNSSIIIIAGPIYFAKYLDEFIRDYQVWGTNIFDCYWFDYYDHLPTQIFL